MANKCHPPSAPLQNCNTCQIRVNMESRQPVEWVTEENYKYTTIPSSLHNCNISCMFRLSSFRDPLLQWLTQEPSPVCPDFRKQDCISFIQSGLQDIRSPKFSPFKTPNP